MKIGIVCYPTFGGSGVLATELGKALADKGHFVTVSNYPLFDYPPYESALAGKLVDVVINEKLDLLHVHYAIPHASAAYMAQQILKDKGYCIPYVTTLHGTDITLVGKDETFKPLVAFSIEHADAITTVSEDLKRDTIKYFDIKHPIDVITNFVDIHRFRKSNKEHFKKAIAPDGEKIIIHTSNFRKVKRVEDVVYIFEKIIQTVPAKLLLIGDGPERHAVEQLCRSLNLLSNVRFLGKQDAMEELLAVGDLFILPSEYESFGLAALEAMACSVPVISTNAGGLPEVNIDGVTGFTSNVGDIESMSNQALKILTDNELNNTFRNNAHQQAQRFELKNILPQYEAIYKRVVEANGKMDCFKNIFR